MRVGAMLQLGGPSMESKTTRLLFAHASCHGIAGVIGIIGNRKHGTRRIFGNRKHGKQNVVVAAQALLNKVPQNSTFLKLSCNPSDFKIAQHV